VIIRRFRLKMASPSCRRFRKPAGLGPAMVIVMEMGLIHSPVGLTIVMIRNVVPDIPLGDVIRGHFPVHSADDGGPRYRLLLSAGRDRAA
jgi:hypothetical protein